MTSQNPPYPYFTGITYNSSFFSSTSSNLTQGEANLLYLRKTVSDTAVATETFSAGIVASSVTTPSIGTSGSGVDLSIGNALVGGKLNLGNGSNHGGQIAIGSLTANPYISIGTAGLGASTNIQIGSSSGSSLTILQSSSAITGALTVASNIDTSALSTNFSLIPSLGAATTMGIGVVAPTYGTVKTIQIGETTVTSVHAGGIDCSGININGAVAPAVGNLTIAGSQTTGILTIGGGVRTTGGSGGGINIGAGVGSAGPITIGSSTNTTAIGKITGGLVLNSSLPTLGIALQSGVNIAYNNAGTSETNMVNYRNTTVGGGGITFYDQITTPTAQPSILMAAFTATGVANTFPTGNLTTERIYTHNVDTENGSATLFLGGTNAATVNIAGQNSRTNAINIGNSGSFASTITMNAPITLGYTIAPVSGQIGYTTGSYLTTSLAMSPAGVQQSVLSIALPVGVWMVNYSLRFINTTGTTTFTEQQLFLFNSVAYATFPSYYASIAYVYSQSVGNLPTQQNAFTGSACIPNQTASTLTLMSNPLYSSTGLPAIGGSSATYLMITRIA